MNEIKCEVPTENPGFKHVFRSVFTHKTCVVSHQSDTGYFNSSDKLKGIFFIKDGFFLDPERIRKRNL